MDIAFFMLNLFLSAKIPIILQKAKRSQLKINIVNTALSFKN